MARSFLKRIAARAAPATARITADPWLRRYLPALTDPDLWHFNRRSSARAVAIGLACGLIPGPLQALAAAVVCVALRANLPLAVVTTFYTNPLTIVPLYAVAYQAGRLLLPPASHAASAMPPDLTFDLDGLASFLHWIASMGPPLAVGLPLLAAMLGLAGFVTVRLAWRWHTLRAWRRRGHAGGDVRTAARDRS
jgi:uncharacterized protein